MAIDLNALKGLVDFDINPGMKSVLDAITPYFPVLKRLGTSAIDGFIDGLRNQDWARIDRELYAKMTEAERDALSAKVLLDARAAVKAAYEANRQWQQDLLRLTFGLVLSVI